MIKFIKKLKYRTVKHFDITTTVNHVDFGYKEKKKLLFCYK